MALTNAQRQAAYRQRHLRSADGEGARLNLVVSHHSARQLTRLATHYGVTKRAMLEQLLKEAETAVLDGMNWQKQKAYLDVTR